jgi:phage repressor protein C with HTH and peptisase S24 domain
MLTHDGVWAAIDRLARRNNMTPSGLARRAGLDPTTFNKSKRFAADGRPRWPSTESIAKILKATSSSPADLFAVDAARLARPARMEDPGLSIPLLGEARAGGLVADGLGPGAELPPSIDQIELLSLDHQPVYAVSVDGDSMEPIFPDGTTLLVSMAAPVEPGQRVVVKTREDVFVKILGEASATHLTLKAANPAHPAIRLAREDVDWIARIIWASQ